MAVDLHQASGNHGLRLTATARKAGGLEQRVEWNELTRQLEFHGH
jgi:hypothetical protein